MSNTENKTFTLPKNIKELTLEYEPNLCTVTLSFYATKEEADIVCEALKKFNSVLMKS